MEFQQNGRSVTLDTKDVNLNLTPSGLTVENRDDETSRRFPFRGFVFAVCWYLLQAIFVKKWGTTPGGRICKLAVVRMDGAPLQKSDRGTRALFSILSGYAMGLGFLWGLFEKDGRGWHDLMAGTKVVETAS